MNDKLINESIYLVNIQDFWNVSVCREGSPTDTSKGGPEEKVLRNDRKQGNTHFFPAERFRSLPSLKIVNKPIKLQDCYYGSRNI